MTTVADNFNRADESPLAAPWAGVTGAGQLSLFGNAVHVFQTGPDEYEVYLSSGVGADQFVQFTIASLGSGVVGALLRFASGSKAGYRFYGDSGSTQIDRQPDGVNIGSAGAGLVNGDVCRFEISGTTISLYVNGVLRCTGTDATYASAGNPGLFAVGTLGGDPAIDTFSAGDIGPATSAAVTGTGASGAVGNDIRAGAKTLILTLTGDTFVAAGATFDAQRQAIIDGIVAGSSPTWGWNNTLASVPVTAVVRTSDTVCTITLPALAGYQSDSDETLTITIPAAAVTLAAAIVATETVTIAKTSTDLTPVDDYTMDGTATRTRP